MPSKWPTLRQEIANLRCDLSVLSERLTKHEANHHSTKTRLFEHFPWMTVAIVVSTIVQIAGRL